MLSTLVPRKLNRKKTRTKNILAPRTQIAAITAEQISGIQSCPEADPELWNTTAGNRIKHKYRDPGKIPVKSAPHHGLCRIPQLDVTFI
ncbi:hypothetical protein JTB14_032643 [Gonioctena quinquepunctata]|nr:hypothetical protein JTB14_032643 [Gonioctena quinquepunctata]